MGSLPVAAWRKPVRFLLLGLLSAVSLPALPIQAAEPQKKTETSELHALKTKLGVKFVIRGNKKTVRQPTIFCLAMAATETLGTAPYQSSGQELAREGWLVVSLDVPGHGSEHRSGEPAGIAAWRTRIEKKDPFVDELATRVSAVIDFLVQEGYADPARLAIEGTSRGGFMAAHVAAREPRFKSVIMYAPVCDLADVTEFHGIEQNPGLEGLALAKFADKLADRRIWLIIGNNDERVNTDRAIQFTREIVRAAKKRKIAPAVTLIVPATPGHSSTEAMHHEAVEWLTRKSAASRP